MDLQELHKEVQNSNESHPTLKLTGGILYYQGKPYLSRNSSLKPLFLQEFHSTPLGGHTGITKTFQRLKANDYWSGTKKMSQNTLPLVAFASR